MSTTNTTTPTDTARCERCRRLRPLESLRAAPDSCAYFCAPSDDGTDGATSTTGATGAPCEPWVRPDTAALLAAWDAQPRGPFVVYSDEGPVWLPDGRKGPGRHAAGWSLSICYPGTSPTDGSHRCIATALLSRENEPGAEALAALLASSRTDVPALCLAVDMLREELARVTRERDEAVTAGETIGLQRAADELRLRADALGHKPTCDYVVRYGEPQRWQCHCLVPTELRWLAKHLEGLIGVGEASTGSAREERQ